ncbi:DUF4226 domain-containing protein [Mycolicibacterium mageritense]|uniref:DUF4226 domain-containing protein n=1 Tax=Mycolicibacterium mageritense TaxID=53462 RepID=UPI0011DA4CB4|nr:DUF4226 domain-containing protein [Mycolicibacterium mageritense]TXI56291.1 MAG: DUF4226 domain-containing protein [Mycolicibacterium mageritense]
MASYEDLRNVIKHITEATGNQNAWQEGLTPQQIRDINGWLASEGVGYKGYKDPETGVIYEDRSHQNTEKTPAVPDPDVDRLRHIHASLFDPLTKAPITPATPPPGPPAPGKPPVNTDPRLDDPTGAPNPNPQPPGEGIATEEESSGRAADAIKKVKAELSDRQSNVHEADAKLTELMLSANAASEEGRAAIQQMQKDIIAALNDPKNNLDTADGELQFLKFLKEKAETAQKLVDDGKVAAADGEKLALALAEYYKQGPTGNSSDPNNPGTTPGTEGNNPGGTPPATDPGLYPTDPGLLGPSEPMPDPMLGDLGLPPDANSGLTDALQAAAPLLSGMSNPLAGGLPGGGLDLGAVTKPIGDAISAAADHAQRDEKPDDKPEDKPGDDDKKPDEKPGEDGKPEQKPGEDDNKPDEPPTPDQPAPTPAPGSVPDPAVAAPPAPPSLNIDLKDGSHVTAADLSRKGATESMLEGTPYGEALRLNNLTAPPPGTTLTNYLSPSQLQPADYAMYQDKLVGVLGPDKWVGSDGRIQPLNTLPQDGFQGFGRPTSAGGTAAPAAPAPPGVAPPPPAAAPASPVQQQTPPPPAGPK